MNKLITIVGVGALGSHVCLLLRNAEASIRVIDFDRVEQKNVTSQFHSKAGVGKLKVQALQQSMNFLFGLKIEAVSSKLVENNTSQLLGKSDLIIDCLDNGTARRLVQAYVRKNQVPCLHGALAADGGFGRSVWDEQFTIDDEPAGVQAATCENGIHLPFISVVSSLIARSAQEFLANGRKVGYQINPMGVIAV